jgi:hypothetical protein
MPAILGPSPTVLLQSCVHSAHVGSRPASQAFQPDGQRVAFVSARARPRGFETAGGMLRPAKAAKQVDATTRDA